MKKLPITITLIPGSDLENDVYHGRVEFGSYMEVRPEMNRSAAIDVPELIKDQISHAIHEEVYGELKSKVRDLIIKHHKIAVLDSESSLTRMKLVKTFGEILKELE